MIATELVRDHLRVPLSPPFAAVLAQLDDISVSPSLAIRAPLARLVVANATLLQRNFSRHSVGEFATSMTLEGIAGTLKAGELRAQLVAHSKDELRHSKIFHALADGLGKFTGSTSYDSFDAIIENDKRFLASYRGDVISFICDVFSGEVRTYSFISAYVTALCQQQSSSSEKIGRVLSQVLDDERRHVEYTARYISQWMGNGLDLRPALIRGFRGFDRVSWSDVAETAEFFSGRT